MIAWKPSIPRWKQLYEILAERIRTGAYAPGDRMPSVMALMDEFGLAVATTQKAVAKLREDGLIYTEPGLGSFVAKQDGEALDQQ
ncbi:GntR family transcriptional regulator [Nonomuraea dietziae]|uniref:GntR family transcriptional regulator n=1 Tax=Nonomuraea dietziae TaxID=65515 RepID=UPI0033FFD802